MIHPVLALGILAAGQPAPVAAAPAAAMLEAAPSPLAFFVGRSRSHGVLRVMFRPPRTVQVESDGVLAADGSLTLTQRIAEQHKPPRTRIFRLRQVSPGRYAGSLTDASGPVTGERRGDTLRLRYRMAGGLGVDQRITLAPGGRVAASRIGIYRMGMLAGTLVERIGQIDERRAVIAP